MQYKVFGCKTNRYFAEKWLVHPYLKEKKGYLIASCVVTDHAKAKWVKHALSVVTSLSSDEKLYLSGCGNIRNGKVDPQFFEVYASLAPWKEKIEILPENAADFDKKVPETLLQKVQSIKSKLSHARLFTRKYIVIQTGCDNFCTFCLTVQARGRHSWRPKDEIIAEILEFYALGGREIVLTGVNIGAWGAEKSHNFHRSKFVELVEEILVKTDIDRIRISSLGVEFFNDAMISLFTHSRINGYVHLSIQSGSSPILQRMHRNYDANTLHRVMGQLSTLTRNDAIPLNIGADLIVGFPGETDEDFQETMNIVKQFHITQLHAFPFSAHMNHYSVPAGLFPHQIQNHISQARLKQLLAAGEFEKQQFLEKNNSKTLRVLVEKCNDTSFSGWSENYIACNEKNFIPQNGENIARGNIITGTFYI